MSNPSPKPSLRERVATAILDAAAVALAERGDDASMADVAEAAGVARATLYRYFPTREALLDALGRAAVEQVGDALDAARLAEVQVDEAVRRAIRALVAAGPYLVVLVRDVGRAERPEFNQRIAAPLRALIDRGREAGALRDDVPAAWMLDSLLALVTTVSSSGPALGTEDTVHALTGLVLDGARARPANPG